MEFGLSGAILLACRRPGFRPVADRFQLSRHVEIARTWSQTGSQLVCDQTSSLAGVRPTSELLASRIAPDRPNSITLADRKPAREPAG